MAQYVNIYIELPVYLIKYMRGVCGQNHLTVSRSSEIGLYVLNRLRDTPSPGFEDQNKPGENKLHLRICTRLTQVKNSGQFLLGDAATDLRRKIDTMFRDDLNHHIRAKHLDTGVNQRQLLRSFFDRYEIEEDDFAEASMYRNYSRWKERKKID